MATIISNEGSIILNGRSSISKGLIVADISDNIVIVEPKGWKLDYTTTTIDGETFASAEEFLAKISSFSKGGGGTGEGVPVGTDRQIYTWDGNGAAIASEFTPSHWSEFVDGAPTSGQWVAAAQFDIEDQPRMGFVEVSTLLTPIAESEGMIPFYSQGGQLRVGMPKFPENAVPLLLLDVRLPVPPETGTFVLRSVNGVASWVSE